MLSLCWHSEMKYEATSIVAENKFFIAAPGMSERGRIWELFWNQPKSHTRSVAVVTFYLMTRAFRKCFRRDKRRGQCSTHSLNLSFGVMNWKHFSTWKKSVITNSLRLPKLYRLKVARITCPTTKPNKLSNQTTCRLIQNRNTWPMMIWQFHPLLLCDWKTKASLLSCESFPQRLEWPLRPR